MTTGPTTRPRVWSIDAPKIPAQVTLAVEDYNRLARMIRKGEQLKMAVELAVQFHDSDPMAEAEETRRKASAVLSAIAGDAVR